MASTEAGGAGEPLATARHELKLVCQESALARVRATLRTSPAGLRRAYPERTVQSVYLDTTFQLALHENLAGIGRREKLRFRWYGDEVRGVVGALERKRRENALGWKDVMPLGEPLDVEGVERVAFVRALAERLPAEWRERLVGRLEPAQWIAYRREYFATRDGAVRVTLDRELRASDQRIRRRLGRRFATPLPRLLVVEVKCGVEAAERAAGIVEALGLRVDRCSKFALASSRDAGPHPSLL